MSTNKNNSSSSDLFPFQIDGQLGSSKANVFLIHSLEPKKHYGLKLYPFKDDKTDPHYLNESRFKGLEHPNVVSFLRTCDKKKTHHRGNTFEASYIIMDLGRYGDFSHLGSKTELFRDEKFLRTYFHQLIKGIEFLHNNEIAHLDLKPDNLLLGEDLNLKISDFDSSFKKNDTYIVSRGTKCYRSPEIRDGSCKDPYAADIYSAGVIIFTLKTGCFPYLEDTTVEGIDLYDLMSKEDPEFWLVHEDLSYHSIDYTPDFQNLFFSMVKEDAIERATIQEIKNSKWYNGPIYTHKEIEEILRKYLLEVDLLKKHQL